MTDCDRDPKVCDLYKRLKKTAGNGGYNLNPDMEMTLDLVEGLQANIDRYGYMACPCRLADGKRDLDIDIICPCDYRDIDLAEFGTCFCALYVDDKILNGEKKIKSIPDRREADKNLKISADSENISSSKNQTNPVNLPYPVFRCKVCGYLCANNQPPGKCPICKADKDRFERFL